MAKKTSVPAAAAKKEIVPSKLSDVFNSVESQSVSRDKLIPKILLMHAMSELAKSKDAKEGDFIETLNGRKLGDVSNPLEFVPIWRQGVWIEYAGDGDDKKFLRVTPITHENRDWDFVGKDDKGGVISRDRCINFVVALVSDLKKGIAVPYIVPFRRAKEGRSAQKLTTAMEDMNIAAGRVKYVGSVMELKTTLGKNTKNQEWLIWDVSEKRATTNAELETLVPLFKEASTGLKKGIDNSDLVGDAPSGEAPSVAQAGF